MYIDDAVNAYLSLVSNINITKGNAYNIGSGKKITIGELVDMILYKINNGIKVIYKDKNFPEISHQYLDSTNIKNDIGWKSKVSLENGITMTIDKYKKILGENK